MRRSRPGGGRPCQSGGGAARRGCCLVCCWLATRPCGIRARARVVSPAAPPPPPPPPPPPSTPPPPRAPVRILGGGGEGTPVRNVGCPRPAHPQPSPSGLGATPARQFGCVATHFRVGISFTAPGVTPHHRTPRFAATPRSTNPPRPPGHTLRGSPPGHAHRGSPLARATSTSPNSIACHPHACPPLRPHTCRASAHGPTPPTPRPDPGLGPGGEGWASTQPAPRAEPRLGALPPSPHGVGGGTPGPRLRSRVARALARPTGVPLRAPGAPAHPRGGELPSTRRPFCLFWVHSPGDFAPLHSDAPHGVGLRTSITPPKLSSSQRSIRAMQAGTHGGHKVKRDPRSTPGGSAALPTT